MIPLALAALAWFGELPAIAKAAAIGAWLLVVSVVAEAGPATEFLQTIQLIVTALVAVVALAGGAAAVRNKRKDSTIGELRDHNEALEQAKADRNERVRERDEAIQVLNGVLAELQARAERAEGALEEAQKFGPAELREMQRWITGIVEDARRERESRDATMIEAERATGLLVQAAMAEVTSLRESNERLMRMVMKAAAGRRVTMFEDAEPEGGETDEPE